VHKRPRTTPHTPSGTVTKRRGAILAFAITLAVALFMWFEHPKNVYGDYSQVYVAATALRSGADPYHVVGPFAGAKLKWNYPLLYPLPAVLVQVPFSYLPQRVAGTLFFSVATWLLAFALSQQQPRALVLFGSMPFLIAAMYAQWGPLLMAASLLPALSWIFAAKPNIGLVYFGARPSRKTAIAVAGFFLASLIVLPSWPRAWLAGLAVPNPVHSAVFATAAGPLLLLSLALWRKPEARLLLLLSVIPHTNLPYELLPLFLIPATLRQTLVLLLFVDVGCALLFLSLPIGPTLDDWVTSIALPVVTVTMYWPALVILLMPHVKLTMNGLLFDDRTSELRK
jgi:hypothetical protein